MSGAQGDMARNGRVPTTLHPPTGSFCFLCGAWRGNLGLEPTPQLYVQHLVQIFREAWRVLKPTGTVWLNLGDSYAAGRTGGASDKSRLNGGRGVGVSEKIKQGPTIPRTAPEGLKPKDLVGIPWRVAFALQADGWYLRSDIIWSKPNPMPESVTDSPTRSHEYVFLLTKTERYYYDAEAIREKQVSGHASGNGFKRSSRLTYLDKDGPRGSDESWQPSARGRNRRSVWPIAPKPFPGAHFAVFPEELVKPCISAGTSERGDCTKCGMPWERILEKEVIPHDGAPGTTYPEGTTANRLAMVSQAGRQRGNDHDNPFPASQTVGWQPTCSCDAITIPAVVLDPFAGSGTVGLVARNLGRKAILFEASEDYCALIMQRLAQTVMELKV